MSKQNFINGQWVDGANATPNINPSNTADVIGEYAQADRAQAEAAIAAARAAFPKWSLASMQQRADILDQIGNEILARKEELGTLLSREEGKTRAEGIGEAARAGYIFKFFAGEAHSRARRARAVGASRHRRRDHARAGRRRRHDHAVELSRSRFRRGRSRPRSPSATASCSSRPTSCRAARGRSPRSSRARRCRRACSISSWAAARSSATRSCARRDVDAISFTGSVPTGKNIAQDRDRDDEEDAARDGRQEPAGRPRRRRPRRRGERLPAERVLLHRTALHGGVAPHRHGRASTTASSRRWSKQMARAQDRRRAQGRHRHRSRRRPEPARPGPALRARSRRTKAASSSRAASA